jgi:hypothetical protein
MAEAAAASPFGIVDDGHRYAVCLGGEVVAQGYSDDRITDPDARAHQDAEIVRTTCRVVTGYGLVAPMLLSLDDVACWLDDEIADLEEAEAVRAACDGLSDATRWEAPEILAGYAEGGPDGAVAALRRCLGLPLTA